jgi:hypothetical protein
MSKAQLAKLKGKLVFKLAKYMIKNTELSQKYPKASYVLFSLKNHELNSSNEDLVDEIKKEGKTAVRAYETGDKKNPWNLITA